jgi:hypothetical protein
MKDPKGEIDLIFLNDSILMVLQKSYYPFNEINASNVDTLFYNYEYFNVRKITRNVKKNQPIVNFKTKRVRNVYLVEIVVKLKNKKNNEYIIRPIDTLSFLKIKKDEWLFLSRKNKDMEFLHR